MNPYRSAKAVLPVVFKVMGHAPSSVVDVGCGNGGWLKAAKELNPEARILGMDFDDPELRSNDLLIPPWHYHQVDLQKPALPSNGSRFELVICLEVAEHLHPEYAEGLIKFLVDLLEPKTEAGILFSAAIPGQGPYGDPDDRMAHHNEQPLSYWQVLFAQHGFVVRDAIRPRIKSRRAMAAIDPWYRTNIQFVTRAPSR